MRRTLLLNWVYYPPVGHLVEAMKVARGFQEADPTLAVSVLLNARTPTELVAACPWISGAYAVDLEEVAAFGLDAPTLRAVPAEWDYVITDERVGRSPFAYAPSLLIFHNVAAEYFRSRRWQGSRAAVGEPGSPAYVPDTRITLRLPRRARWFARRFNHAGPRFCLLLAGSSRDQIYPSLSWWRRLLMSLQTAFPESRSYITGASPDASGKTSTPIDHRSVVRRLGSLKEVEICYDLGLWNQLALLERCDVLIAPHTGFAFLAPCVGTPWLAISGGRWPEYVFNRTPFFCALPRCREYPCYFAMRTECRHRLAKDRRVLCMEGGALDDRIPDIVLGAGLLLDPRFDYSRALAHHRRRLMVARIARQRVFSLDDALGLAADGGSQLV